MRRSTRACCREDAVDLLGNLHQGPWVLPEVIRLGEPAIPRIEAILRGPSQSVYHARYLAADALAAIGGPAATAALVRALRDSVARTPDPASLEAESVIVNRIADHLAEHPGPQGVEALLEALGVRPYPSCARALGRLQDPRAIPLLTRCLDDDAAREAAAGALRRLGRVACAPLAFVLASPRGGAGGFEAPSHVDGRAAAARALGELLDAGLADASAALALGAALQDAQRAVRIEAALALARRAGNAAPEAAPEAARVLAAGLDEAGWARAEVILAALTRLAAHGGLQSVIEAAIVPRIAATSDGLKDGAEPEGSRHLRRIRAATLAGRLGASAAIAPLRALAEESDPVLRLAAVTALMRIPAASPEDLLPFLSDAAAAVRRRAVVGLRKRHGLDPSRAALLLGDPARAVRKLAAAALRESGPAARPAARRILRKLGSPAGGLARRAVLCWRLRAWLREN